MIKPEDGWMKMGSKMGAWSSMRSAWPLVLETAVLTVAVTAMAQAQTATPATAPTAAAAKAAGSETLPEINVEAAGERATGPVSGFTAKRSATGTKTDTPLIETPQSISVVTQDEVQARGAANIKEAVGYTSGVTPSPALDVREDLITFRGFPIDWASSYLDGLQMPSSTYAISTVDPFGLERLEVLKGPASMLYGQTSTGGILNMVSKRPTLTPYRQLGTTIGDHNRYQGTADFGGPIDAEGHFSYRLTGLLRRSGTEVDYVRDDRLYFAPSVMWRPTTDTSLTVLASYQRDDAGDSGGTQAFLPASGIALYNPNGKISRDTYGGEPDFDYYRKKQFSLGYEFQHRFDDTWSFEQNVRYRRVDLEYQTAYGTGLLASDASRRTLRRSAFGSFGGAHSFLADNRAQAKWDVGIARNTTLFGVDFRRTVVSERYYFGAGPTIDIFDPVYGSAIALPANPTTDQRIESRQVGFYAQNQAKLDDHWIVTLGARWDVAKTDVLERRSGLTYDQTDRKLTGRAGLSYLFDNGVSPYVSFATSFTPTLDPNYYGEPFKAKTGKQYEAGVKYQPPGSDSLMSAAVFDITQRNVLTDDPDQVNHPFGQVQTGEYRSRGLELEAKVGLTEALRMIASYTYLNGEYTESNGSNLGNSPKGIPKHSAAMWLDYAVQGGPLDGVSVGGGARYIGERPNTDSNIGRFMVPDATLFDAAIRYELEGYRLALNVNNIADKETYDCWSQRCWYGQGRTIRLNLTRTW